MKKILVFSTNYLPFIGGAELAIDKIASHLPDSEFHLIAPRYTSTLAREEVIGNVRVYRVGFGKSIDKFLIPLTGLVKAITLHRREKFDAVWSMMASQASVAAAFFKLFRPRVPLVLTLQEGDEEEYLKRYAFGNETLYKLLIKPWHTLVFKVADLVTVISKHLESRAWRANPALPVVRVANGVDVKLFESASAIDARMRARRAFGFSDSDYVVATVSRLVEKNRVDTLIRAIAVLPPSYKLLIAGIGNLETELRWLATELGVASRITFVGRVEPSGVPGILSAADVFARPSASEGFGSAFLEAMAARVPVIATPVGGITDFLTDKETGLFCAVGDSDDLARKITMLTRDQILRAEIIEHAHRMVSEHYDWSVIARAMNRHAFTPLFSLKKERILIATGFYPPSFDSQAKYALHLREHFWGMGYATRVCIYSASLPPGIRHVVYFFRILAGAYMSDWVLALDTFSVGVPTVLATRLLGKKTIARVGGDFLWEQYVQKTGNDVVLSEFYQSERKLGFKYKLVSGLIRFSLGRFNSLVFNTKWQRDIWIKPYKLSLSRTAVIENFYGEKLSAETPQKKNFIYAGRSIKIKNVERLKKAFAHAQKKEPSIELEILSVPHEELMRRVKSAYAVVLVSLSDVSPNFIAEAIQYEKPFILTKECGILHHTQKLGVIVDPLSEKEIQHAFLSLSDASVYKDFKEQLKQFNFKHSWQDIASEFIAVFKTPS